MIEDQPRNHQPTNPPGLKTEKAPACRRGPSRGLQRGKTKYCVQDEGMDGAFRRQAFNASLCVQDGPSQPGRKRKLQHAHPDEYPGHGRTTPSPTAIPRPGHIAPRRPAADEVAPSEGRARVFVSRAVCALASLGIGTPASRELLRLMLHFLPAGALSSGRPWLPMGAAKLAALAGTSERTLARRVAELRALGLLARHLDQWNHPARAEDGSRCGYDLGPLVERAAELNAALDRLFEDQAQARREARRSASLKAAQAAASGVPILPRWTGGDDAHVTPIQTTNPDPKRSEVNSSGEEGSRSAAITPTMRSDARSRGGASPPEGPPGPRRAARLLAALSPDYAMLLRGLARDPEKPDEGDLLAAADHLARHLGVPRAAWARVAPNHDRTSLAALVVLGQAQDAGAFRSSRVAWVTAMLRRPGVDPWPSVHRALAQKAQGVAAKPNRFLN